jgi:hypothetical protein
MATCFARAGKRLKRKPFGSKKIFDRRKRPPVGGLLPDFYQRRINPAEKPGNSRAP